MEAAIAAVIAEGRDVTYDLGGDAGTQAMAAGDRRAYRGLRSGRLAARRHGHIKGGTTWQATTNATSTCTPRRR